MDAPTKAIAYLRVSTQRQGIDGYGVQGQRDAIRAYLARIGATLIGEYSEVESGGRNDRPELARALRACRMHGATLVVARLDRLSRDVLFVARLQRAGVPFIACDMPEANEMTIILFSAVAQYERKLIGQRTRAALAVAKARGVIMGGHPERLTPTARRLGAQRSAANRQAAATVHAGSFVDTIADLRAAGVTSLSAIAREFERRGIPTPGGRARWSPTQVRRVVSRLDVGKSASQSPATQQGAQRAA